MTFPRQRMGWAILLGALASLLPVAKASASYEAPPVVWDADAIQNAQRGYLGCVQGETGTTIYCFVAHTLSDGNVRVVAELVQPTMLPSLAAPLVFDEIVGADALSVSSIPGGLKLHLRAELAGVGVVDLEVLPILPMLAGTGNESCIGFPILYELRSPERSIAWARSVDGTVDGVEVDGYSTVCGAYFVGPTSGAWVMPAGTFRA